MMKHFNRKIVPVGDLPTYIKGQYRHLALVTHQDQVDLIDQNDEKTLIVSCGWLLWQELVESGRHAVYYELGILDWDEPDTLGTDLNLRANDWVYELGNDAVMFQGVSIGRMFGAEISMALLNYHRIIRCLRKLIERFGPEEIWLFDFTLDINLLGEDMRKMVVQMAVRECGVGFIDRSSDTPRRTHEVGEEVFVRKEHGRFSLFLLSVYSWVLETVSGLRCFFSPRERRVLVQVISNMATPLIRNFSSQGLTPMFLGRTVPKKLDLLWRCLKHGLLLVTPRTAALSPQDQRRIDAIHDAFDAACSKPSEGSRQFIHLYFRHHALETGRLMEMARLIKAVDRLLERYKPARIVVDGVRHVPPLIYVELAGNKGIAIDYIWHSPLSPQNKKLEALGTDPHRPSKVTRCLTWGRTNERWLDRTGAQTARVRVGSPLRDKYTRQEKMTLAELDSPGERKILLLQYTYQIDDLAGLNTNMYENFVNTILELRKLGYSRFRFKLHPGPGRWKKSYFESIAEHYGLGCKILKTEPFHEQLDWADIVIGPAATGALYETLAAGKPYHAFLLSPHSLDAGYFEGYPLLTSVDQLPQALANDTPPDGRKLIDNLYSSDEFPNPSKRFWAVLENNFA